MDNVTPLHYTPQSRYRSDQACSSFRRCRGCRGYRRPAQLPHRAGELTPWEPLAAVCPIAPVLG
jgi:hypothetical protein